jgi:hypothetical protein
MIFRICKRADKLSISYFKKQAMNTKRNEQMLTNCYEFKTQLKNNEPFTSSPQIGWNGKNTSHEPAPY